ncbi:MAG: thioredoxin-disulfide reductase [Actinomycetota bacterium]|nr:thioredoxin-disulfide reductase [Actinomycetota bacterium]
MGPETYEVAIIGGGPAGLTAGIYLRRSHIEAVLLERELPGGQPITSPLVENYPGFPEGIAGVELMERMRKQAERFNLEFKTFSPVEGLVQEGSVKHIQFEGGEVKSLSVIVATGRSPRKLGVEGEEEFFGRGVSYCATCDGPLFSGKTVMVVGGGDAAAEEALYLTRFAKKVILVHRRDELRASDYLAERVSNEPTIQTLWNSEVSKIEGDTVVKRVVISNNKTGEQTEVDVSGVFIYVGNIPNTGFLPEQVKRDAGGFLLTNESFETDMPGVFAAGDVRSGNFKQILVAAAEGAIASKSAQRYLEDIGAREAYKGERL